MINVFRWLLLLVVLPLWGQDPNFVRIDNGKGLPSDEIFSILQDKRGFVWVATENGLYRYDGFIFKPYPLSTPRLRAGASIKEDAFGRVWYITFDGWLFYAQGDSMCGLPKQQQPAGNLDYGLSASHLFVNQKQGVDIYDLKTLRLTKGLAVAINKRSASVASGASFYVLADSLIEIDGDGRVRRWELPGEKRTFTSIINSGSGDPLIYNRQIGPKKAFRLTASGLTPWFELPTVFIHSAYFVDRTFWFCTEAGIYTYDENGKALNNGLPYFPSLKMTCLMNDREGNYWFGSKDKGLIFVDDLRQRMLLSDQHIKQLIVVGNQLWCATEQGRVLTLSLPAMTLQQTYNEFEEQSIYMLNYDSVSNQFMATTSQHFYIRNQTGMLLKSVTAVKSCARLSSTYYVFAGSGICGLLKYSSVPDPIWDSCYANQEQTNVSNFPSVSMVGNVRGRAVVVMSGGHQAYAASNSGLFSITPQGAVEVRRDGESVYFTHIVAVGDVLYGRNGAGELISLRNGNQFETLTARYALPDEMEQLYARNNHLFLVKGSCIYQIDLSQPGTKATRIETNATDIYDLDCWSNQLLVATPEGVLMRELQQTAAVGVSPLLVVNFIQANGTITNTKGLLDLTHAQQEIAINYSILAFGSELIKPLSYQLNNRPWTLCDPGSRTLKLAALAPGSYVLRLGFDNEPATIVYFKIAQPWWWQSWAIVCWVLLFLLLVVLLFRWQLRLHARKAQLKTERLELERNLNRSVLTAIRSQMNPHFFFNALNTIQSYIFENDRQNASNYLSKFSRLTRMILEMSDREQMPLSEEIDALRLYLELEKARFDTDFSFSIEVTRGVDQEMLRIPPMLLQPYVENAVKHGLLHKKGPKEVSLQFVRENNLLIVRIDDNGIGRKRSAELNRIRDEHHRSFASEANQKRLELLNKGRSNKLGVEYIDKTDEAGNVIGTTVIISIPIS